MKYRVIEGFRYGNKLYIPQYKYPWYWALLKGQWDWNCYTRLGSDELVAFTNLEVATEYRGPNHTVVWEGK